MSDDDIRCPDCNGTGGYVPAYVSGGEIVGPDVCHTCEGSGETALAIFVRRILDHWDDWDGEAQQQAQQHQLPEAWSFAMQARLSIVLEDLVEACAKVCEGRAECRQNQIPIYNEARKCADQIRHNIAPRLLNKEHPNA